MSLTGKVVIVTGGGSGIGAAIAIDFVKEGAKVAIAGRREENLKAVAEKCDGEVFVIQADVSKEEDAIRIIQAAVDKFGKLDVLVNNAGISKLGSICEGNILQSYDAVMNTNLRAVLHLTALATPHLTKTKGNVINISSIASSITAVVPDMFTYSISKAALSHFTRCAATELASRGVRVNSVNPGPVKTGIFVSSSTTITWDELKRKTLLNRIAEPKEIAYLVTFLASDKARGITGSEYVSDNGFLLKRE